MTPAYRVFIAIDVIAALRSSRGADKQAITRLFDELADNPFRPGDYVERDEAGRLVQVLIFGRRAVCFWADHAVKEVKILELRSAGN
jgi:hypothetical protein